MRFYGLVLTLLLMSNTLKAQRWEVLQRTSNNLIRVETEALKKDTLRLIFGESYEINLPDLFDQSTGQLQKKLYVQNMASANYLDLEIRHEQNIIDLNDTLYLAKIKFQQKENLTFETSSQAAKIVVRDQNGRREKELVILPAESTHAEQARR